MAGPVRREQRIRPEGTLLAALVVTGAGLLMPGGMVAAQDATDPASSSAPPPVAATAPATTEDGAQEAREGRFPLIREGSRLVRVRGLVDRDPRTRALRLTIDESDPQSPGHQLVLMPSSRLTELEMVLGVAPTVQARMIVTGRVFVFDGRNYVLLTHPAVPDERALLGDDSGSDDPAAGAESAEAGDADADAGDSVDDIARELERDVGPAGRRTPASGARAGDEAVIADLGRLMPEGTRIVDRRGKIRRTPGGGYVFVFDADTGGASDAPVMLLPCRLLESLARIASGSGDEAAVLLSGEVTIHDGRNYLLPSVFRIPREQTRLRP